MLRCYSILTPQPWLHRAERSSSLGGGQMKITTLRTILIIAAGMLVAPLMTAAQESEAGPLYVSVDCMKSRSADYANVETEIWQPMHQELVNQGKRNSWALYSVYYGDRSKCDYYTVTTYLGEEQLNADPGYGETFEAVHADKVLTEEMRRTMASRERVATALWVSVDSTEIKEHRYAVVNMMRAEDPDVYERMESRTFKPGHEALIEGGHRAGWSVYALVSPTGTSIPYNYSTVDFMNRLGPAPVAESMMSANPDQDLEAMYEMLKLRENVSSETWVLVAATE